MKAAILKTFISAPPLTFQTKNSKVWAEPTPAPFLQHQILPQFSPNIMRAFIPPGATWNESSASFGRWKNKKMTGNDIMTETSEELQSRKGRASVRGRLRERRVGACPRCSTRGMHGHGAGTESSPSIPDKGEGRAGAHPAAALDSSQLPPMPKPQPRQQWQGWECSGRRISLCCTHRMPSLLPSFDAMSGNYLKPCSIKTHD